LLKETTGAFDGAKTHGLPITSKTRYPLRHVALPSLGNINKRVSMSGQSQSYIKRV